ncbi:MAG: Zn-dependent alcohol dehydrogenase [Acidimicrobiales bacterium]|nr:Zn-dependent alcohol dehydrogenase [Acidimicrobiales bacterium]
MARAAVLTSVGAPLEVREDVEVAPPGPGEVRIKTGASGVCHSDLSVQNGTIPLPTPIVLGHEGAGTVVEVGDGVTNVAPGDHVVLSFVPSCGECYTCRRGQNYLCEKSQMAVMGGLLDGTTRLSSGGAPLHQMAMCGTFSNETIVPAISVVKIDNDIPLKIAALIGCSVLTGVGAALNTADIQEGDTVAVLGCGGVGLNVIQGAVLAGAGEIIAIDTFESKLELAKHFGATSTVKVGDAGADAVTAVMDLSAGRGADVSFEVIGLGPTMEQAINMVRSGGEVVFVGVPRMDVMLNLPAAFTFLYLNKSIKGCWYGSSVVQRDVPKLLDLYREGRLMLNELISREIDVSDINDAFGAMQAGEVARSVVVYE